MTRWAVLLYGLGISGGANVIFEHAFCAVQKGVEVTIISRERMSPKDTAWHRASKFFGYQTLEESEKQYFDVAIATEWRSAYDISMIKADKYIYFVQSIESRFFRNSKEMLPFIANMSYHMDLYYVTEASWIKQYLKKHYGIEAALVRNGMDKEKFSPAGTAIERRSEGHIRFLIEGSVTNWLKNVKRTVALCRQAGAEEIWLVTPDNVSEYEGVNRVFSKVAFEVMPKIYRSCDVLVKLSLVEGMFGPPLEMFHCGGTVIAYNIEGSEEYMCNGENSLIVPKGDEEAVIRAIKRLMLDRELLEKLKAKALETAKRWITWQEASECFVKVVGTAPVQTSEQKEKIKFKGTHGAKAYRYVESTVGTNSNEGRIERAAELLKAGNRKLLIYGAGLTSRGCIYEFDKRDLPVAGIVVSDKRNNPNTVLGHFVREIGEYFGCEDRYLIYISSDKYYEEIKRQLEESGFQYIV